MLRGAQSSDDADAPSNNSTASRPVMPTLPMIAPELPAADAAPADIVARALEMVPNTPAFDLTGHPSITLPCGEVDGLGNFVVQSNAESGGGSFIGDGSEQGDVSVVIE